MNLRIKLYILLLAVILGMLAGGCSKDTAISPPVIVSFLVSEISANSAVCGGEITSDGGSAITARGVCWSIVKHPVASGMRTLDGSGTGIFTSSIKGLTPSRQYFVRPYASNAAGTAYGMEMIFSTINAELVSDADGNLYHNITLGTQTWLTEDLKTTLYNDNLPIPEISIASTWSALTTDAYCWFNNDSAANKDTYGALYNWYTVNTGKLCPAGWHVPSDSEWKTLEMFIGLTQAEADGTGFRGVYIDNQLKTTAGWNNKGNGVNSFGFSAMPGGVRNGDGTFDALGYGNNWWSSSGYDNNTAWKRGMYYFSSGVFRGFYNKQNGYSVRCLKDNF